MADGADTLSPCPAYRLLCWRYVVVRRRSIRSIFAGRVLALVRCVVHVRESIDPDAEGREPMKIAPVASVVSVVIVSWSTTTLAQQPAVYPLRSQPAATQSVDSAYCYWQAKRQTGVDMTHLSQRPNRTKPIQFAADAGKGASEPPLPPAHGAPGGAAKTAQALTTASEAGGASAASGAPPAARSNAASANTGSAQVAPSAPGASGPGAASASASASANLPPLPPPQPPMTTYWQAYGDCMQARGYGVR